MKFLELCKELFGDRVVINSKDLQLRSSTTFNTTNKLKIILKLKSVEEVSRVVELANQYNELLYSVSCGQNYGYGNSTPDMDGAVLVDLSLMNTIFNYDEKQGYITVGPGVTFLQVFEFLESKNSDYILSGTGAPANSSLIGNLAERGIGKGLNGNRSDFACSLEIVLPSGKVINTGMGKYSDSAVKNLTRWGPGPQIDGLFIQSNLGIITKATFWLAKKPTHFQSFIYTIKDQSKLPNLVDALHSLKQKGIIESNLAVFNDYRVVAFFDSYPFKEHDKYGECLPREILHKQLEGLLLKSATWFGDGALFNFSEGQAKENRKLVKKELSPFVDDLIFFNKSNIGFYKFIAKMLKKIKKKLILEDLFSVFFDRSAYLGFPTYISLRSTYWRKKNVPSIVEPIKDNCGVYWLGPMVPFEGDHVQKAVAIIEKIVTQYGFEPAMTLQCLTSRQIDIITSITFNRDYPLEEKRAKLCHDQLLEVLINNGYYPYRLGTQSHLNLPISNDYSFNLLKDIKMALDPNDIMAPGRYDFRNNWKDQKIKKAA